jgi:hypothetical protein
MRSRYDSASLTILINLDHPVTTAALGGGAGSGLGTILVTEPREAGGVPR